MKVSLVAGARPNFIKIAPLIHAFSRSGESVRLIHTGQHYDAALSGNFFSELEIPAPHVYLGTKDRSSGWHMREILQKLEVELTENRPDVLLVVGDVDSTVVAALAAARRGISLAHVEAGLRSFDRSMPEENNRVVVDTLSDWLFASEPSAVTNLRREGVPAEKIHLVGNVLLDTLFFRLNQARALDIPATLGLSARQFALLTLHRPSNVDRAESLRSIFRAVRRISSRLPVVFPTHPRTLQRIEEFGLGEECQGLIRVPPMAYLSLLGLVDGARMVLTDSGGLQEETTALRIPCLTLRENTERPLTLDEGSNRLVGTETDAIIKAAEEVLEGPHWRGKVPELWDGRAAPRIVEILSGWNACRQSSTFAHS